MLSWSSKDFNPRTREGCDTADSVIQLHTCTFQSTHPRRVRPSALDKKFWLLPFQSTHPRRVRPVENIEELANRNISIHAPAKGATNKKIYILEEYVNFNPRTREGCDKMILTINNKNYISIHAPAKGATRVFRKNQTGHLFQSTHPRRVRPSVHVRRPLYFYFNPRTREGCDLASF